MRAVVQRVQHASVKISGQTEGEISNGMLVFLGIEDSDGPEDIHWLSKKIANLRIFNDSDGVMNISLLDNKGGALVISQFTLHASTRKGNRPSYIRAAKPEVAIPIYEEFIARFENELGRKVAKGIFGADMQVELLNDGPVTIVIDTKNRE
jgi:D-tyrosyl-tRNA(Tyr) deacylase